MTPGFTLASLPSCCGGVGVSPAVSQSTNIRCAFTALGRKKHSLQHLAIAASMSGALMGALACSGATEPFQQPLKTTCTKLWLPAPDVVSVGETITLFHHAVDSRGEIVDGAFAFTLADSSLASISPVGAVTGKRPGRTLATMRCGTASGTQVVIVTGTPVTNAADYLQVAGTYALESIDGKRLPVTCCFPYLSHS